MREQVRPMGMCVAREPRVGRGLAQWGTLLVAGAVLAGCSGVRDYYDSKLPFDTPIDWWHQLQGGVIAEERPAPPGVGDPYPNLGMIPAKPTPPDAVARKALSTRLEAERNRTDRADAAEPIKPLPGVGPKPAAAAPVAAAPAPMARIEAAEAKPAAPAAAPVAAAPAPAALQAAAAPTAPPRRTVPGQPLPSGPVPALPAGPPEVPALPGMPAVAPVVAAGGSGVRASPQVLADFVGGSAVLRPESDEALKQLAAHRFAGTLLVLGGGNSASARPDDQAEALPLAWRRAQAMAAVLAGAGVPARNLRVDAAALARGGTVRLVD